MGPVAVFVPGRSVENKLIEKLKAKKDLSSEDDETDLV